MVINLEEVSARLARPLPVHEEEGLFIWGFFFFYYNYQTSSDKPMKKFIYKLIQGLIKDVSLLIHKD